MNGSWNLIAEMTESGFLPEIQEELQSSGPLCESPREDERSVCSSAAQDRVCKVGRREGKNGEKQ